ncbi:hypothetical protein PSN45_003117 [Yamadazyma tenuis]|uniref:Allantoate permease n=1 Tax=Candida tenuis (strain ATCC 10573 / BCRC 21748 / CBS 615 / JCM 9827 / NBRC 10315 / NRRL Y-1498 / VKM Y-70) TaxID=590646 RepID=G3AZC5_CANTC|nr:uncharacterized protein CANTEDRAFT_101323 [Yamadazyma tenuis ATCC 10573]EGV66060.1 hypothetical protein CANTEDRAFT_101323 [Yamadazyma tenuis ATCC 10573]WEJ95594.1 hypothetical protein PSN45_003117 [Yamadazyma tenuis]
MSDSDIKQPETVLTTVLSGDYKHALNEEIARVISPGGKEIKVTADVDEAMEIALESKDIVLTPEEDRQLLRKIDLYLMPFFTFMYAVQYMDKITNSFASIMGLKTDLGMVGNTYSWLSTAFYLGYLVFELPASLILQRFPVAKATSAFMLLWGIVVCLAPAANLPGFMFLRVVLGMLESSITPAMVILTGQWYKRHEHFMRTTVWLSACSLGVIIGYAFAYGLYIHGSNWSVASWKVVYIVIGLVNIVMGVAFYFHIPDNPTKAWFLNDRERLMVVERIRSNNQGFGNKHFKWSQLKECLTDYRIWLMFVFQILDEVPNGGLTNFSSILLNDDFGYSVKKSLIMNIPVGVVGFFGSMLVASTYEFGLVKHRMAVSTFALGVALMGSSLLAFADSKTARLAGFYVMQISDIGFICMLSIYQSNVAGHTKKVVGNALLLIAYCAGNCIGPQTFRSNEAPHYKSAKGAIVGCYAACIALILVLYYSYYRENEARARKREEMGDAYVKLENIEFADLTDKENPEFRYTL